MTALAHYGADPHVLRLTKILRRLLDHETFTTMADLRDAFACEIAALNRRARPLNRIVYEGWDLDAAFDIVGSNRPLLAVPEVPCRREPIPEPPVIGAAEARALIAAHKVTIRTMGAGHDAGHEARVRAQADQFRAKGSDPTDERARARLALAEERIAWERQQERHD
jgi:hypothetical protein